MKKVILAVVALLLVYSSAFAGEFNLNDPEQKTFSDADTFNFQIFGTLDFNADSQAPATKLYTNVPAGTVIPPANYSDYFTHNHYDNYGALFNMGLGGGADILYWINDIFGVRGGVQVVDFQNPPANVNNLFQQSMPYIQPFVGAEEKIHRLVFDRGHDYLYLVQDIGVSVEAGKELNAYTGGWIPTPTLASPFFDIGVGLNLGYFFVEVKPTIVLDPLPYNPYSQAPASGYYATVLPTMHQPPLWYVPLVLGFNF